MHLLSDLSLSDLFLILFFYPNKALMGGLGFTFSIIIVLRVSFFHPALYRYKGSHFIMIAITHQ